VFILAPAALLVFLLAMFSRSIPDSAKAESEDHPSCFILVGALLSAVVSSLCSRLVFVLLDFGFSHAGAKHIPIL
jgi:hypothetical protein